LAEQQPESELDGGIGPGEFVPRTRSDRLLMCGRWMPTAAVVSFFIGAAIAIVGKTAGWNRIIMGGVSFALLIPVPAICLGLSSLALRAIERRTRCLRMSGGRRSSGMTAKGEGQNQHGLLHTRDKEERGQ
jgi:hypothetical protein